MDRESLSLWADVMGVVTGTMAVFGIGGILTWRIREGNQGRLERIGKFLTYSLKFGLSVFALLMLAVPSAFLISLINAVFVILLVGLGIRGPDGSSHSTQSFFATFITSTLLLVPVGVVVSAIIIDGSLRPWHWFRRQLWRKTDNL